MYVGPDFWKGRDPFAALHLHEIPLFTCDFLDMSLRMARRPKSSLDTLVAPVAPLLKQAAGLAVVGNLIWIAQGYVIARTVAGLLDAEVAGFAPLTAAILFAVLGLIRAGLSYVGEGRAFEAADRLTRNLRTKLVTREAQAITLDYGAAGSIAALSGEKLDILQPYLTRFFPARARTMVVPIVILVIAFYYSWVVGLIFLITGPLIPVFMALVGKAAQSASEKQLDEVASMNDLLYDRLNALLDMRLLNAGERMQADFATCADSLRTRTMAVLRIAFLSSTLLELFSAIGIAAIAVFLGFSLLGEITFGATGDLVTPFEVIFLLLLAPEFYQPLRDMSAAWHDRASAAALAKDFAKWDAAAVQPILGQGSTPLAGAMSLAVSNVTINRGETRISYPDFGLTAGQSVALVGPSGVGKSTLLAAVAGLLEPSDGRITVHGLKLADDTAKAWRERLGWMPQRPHFLDETLRRNVAFSDDDITEALRTAGVLEVVSALPEGDATVLGETGGGLSGGEARRITLARAIHARPALLLADEPTADLDAETAQIVTDGLLTLQSRGTALLIATHDETLAARMDRVIRLEAA